MICIKVDALRELGNIDDELKAFITLKIQFAFLFLKIENSLMSL